MGGATSAANHPARARPTVSSPHSIQELPDGDPEVAQEVGEGQLVVGVEDADRVVPGVEVHRPRLGIEHADDRHPHFQILGDLRQHLRPAVVGGKHLDDQVGRDVQVAAPGQRSLRHLRIAVERHIGTAKGVRVALGDDAGVVAHDVAEIEFPHVMTQNPHHVGTDPSVIRPRWVHPGDPPPHQLDGMPRIGPTGELFNVIDRSTCETLAIGMSPREVFSTTIVQHSGDLVKQKSWPCRARRRHYGDGGRTIEEEGGRTMAAQPRQSIYRQIDALFRVGTLGGLSDGALLERFVTGSRDDASAAFSVLVERHGPMVLRLCRRVLDDPHDAEDAAQAVFLVLARKARRVRRRDSVGSWLFGVAVRVARQARHRADRRRHHERVGGEMVARARAGNTDTPASDDGPPWAELYDELNRLPESLRAPLVLCYLEGLTHEQAADRLGTSPRTLRRRLADGRERLKVRLTRRGVGPAAGLIASALVPEAARSVCVPAAWADQTVHAALQFAATGTGPAAVATLAQEVLRSMFRTKLQLATTAALLSSAIAVAGLMPLALGQKDDQAKPTPPQAQTPAPAPDENPPPENVDRPPLPDFVTARPRTGPGRTTQLHIVAADTGAPIPHANVRVRKPFDDFWTRTDADGRIAIEHSTGPADTYFIIDVWGNGHAMQRHLYGVRGTPIPDEDTIELQPGKTLGGMVRDDQDRPVAGAIVSLTSLNSNIERKDPAELLYDLRATTGPDGRWQTGGAPETTGELRTFSITHPDYISDRQRVGVREPPPIDELRAGTAVSVLKKGVPIEGRVLDDEGNPVAGALVITTEHPSIDFASIRDFAVATDDDGHFRTGQLRPGTWHIVVRAPGHAPSAREIKIGTAIPQVEIRLGTPRILPVRVVDPEGRPITGAFVNVDNWRRYHCLGVDLWTDSEGRAVWDSAPADRLLARVSLTGYLMKSQKFVMPSGEEIVTKSQQFVVPNGEEVVVTLTPSITVQGTLRDAETKMKIGDARVEVGTVDPETGEVKEWTRPSEALLMASRGSLNVSVPVAFAPLQLRIIALGHAPFVSRTFEADERAVDDYEVLLTPAEPGGRTATVVLPDGTPLADARVVVAAGNRETIHVRDGELEQAPDEGDRRSRTNADGSFPVPPLRELSLVFVLGKTGYAYATTQELDESTTIQALPFARIEGRYLIGDRPGANRPLMLRGDLQVPETNDIRISFIHERTTDAEGRFAFDQVIPMDDLRLMRMDPEDSPQAVRTNGEAVRVVPGETLRMTYGGTGQTVLGQVAPPLGWTEPVDFTAKSRAYIVTNRASTPYPLEQFRDQTNLDVEANLKWAREWLHSPEGRAYRAGLRELTVGLAPDGSFRVDDVPPDEYRVIVLVGEEPFFGDTGPFATVSRTIVIPSSPGGRIVEPLDLGLMRLRPRTTLEVGQKAPGVEVTTVEGKSISIPEDYRGKYLLLDFGAPYKDQSRFQIARVNGLRAKFDDDRLAIISLIVGEDDTDAREFVADRGQPWPQAIVGPFPNPVAQAYGLEDAPYGVGSSLPMLILIGPGGTVLGRDANGREIEKVLAKELQP